MIKTYEEPGTGAIHIVVTHDELVNLPATMLPMARKSEWNPKKLGTAFEVTGEVGDFDYWDKNAVEKARDLFSALAATERWQNPNPNQPQHSSIEGGE